MSREVLREVAEEEGWTDATLLEVLLDGIDELPATGSTLVDYVRLRAGYR